MADLEELRDVIVSAARGFTPTIFQPCRESSGTALQDLYDAVYDYEQALNAPTVMEEPAQVEGESVPPAGNLGKSEAMIPAAGESSEALAPPADSTGS